MAPNISTTHVSLVIYTIHHYLGGMILNTCPRFTWYFYEDVQFNWPDLTGKFSFPINCSLLIIFSVILLKLCCLYFVVVVVIYTNDMSVQNYHKNDNNDRINF